MKITRGPLKSEPGWLEALAFQLLIAAVREKQWLFVRLSIVCSV